MWALVEIMGHRLRAGTISDCQIGGQTMLRVEHPTAADHTGDEPLTEYYAPGAIFAIRPCSRDAAEACAKACWPGTTVEPPALPPAFEDVADDISFDDVDVKEY